MDSALPVCRATSTDPWTNCGAVTSGEGVWGGRSSPIAPEGPSSHACMHAYMDPWVRAYSMHMHVYMHAVHVYAHAHVYLYMCICMLRMCMHMYICCMPIGPSTFSGCAHLDDFHGKPRVQVAVRAKVDSAWTRHPPRSSSPGGKPRAQVGIRAKVDSAWTRHPPRSYSPGGEPRSHLAQARVDGPRMSTHTRSSIDLA